MNHGEISIYKNLRPRKSIDNEKKKKRMNNLSLQDTKPDLAHSQKKNLILKNILTEINRIGNELMKTKQKGTHRNITHIISNSLKVIKSTNQSGKTEKKNQASIIRKQDNRSG